MSDPHAQPSAPSAWPAVIFSLLGFALFAGLILYILNQAGLKPDLALEEQRARERAAALSEARARDAERLSQTAWVDQATGVARIPIDRAMEIEVRALRRKPIQPGPLIQPAELAPSNITPPPPPVPGT